MQFLTDFETGDPKVTLDQITRFKFSGDGKRKPFDVSDDHNKMIAEATEMIAITPITEDSPT